MKAEQARVLSTSAIQKNDQLIELDYDNIKKFIFEQIRHQAERGFKTYRFVFGHYIIYGNPGFYDLIGPGLRTIMKRLRTDLRALDYSVTTDDKEDMGTLYIRWDSAE